MEETLLLFSWGSKGWGDELVLGALVTAEVALVAFACGLLLGFIGAIGKLSGRLSYALAHGYSAVFRGLPELHPAGTGAVEVPVLPTLEPEGGVIGTQ